MPGMFLRRPSSVLFAHQDFPRTAAHHLLQPRRRTAQARQQVGGQLCGKRKIELSLEPGLHFAHGIAVWKKYPKIKMRDGCRATQRFVQRPGWATIHNWQDVEEHLCKCV